MRGISERFVASGLRLLCLNFISSTLHPELIGRTYTWTRGAANIDVADASRSAANRDAFVNSPLVPVFRDRTVIRRRLIGAGAKLDFPILERFRAESGTDYVALPVEFFADRISAVTVLTDHSEGFIRTDLDRMERATPAVCPRRRGVRLRTLLDTYVGRNTGNVF